MGSTITGFLIGAILTRLGVPFILWFPVLLIFILVIGYFTESEVTIEH